MKYIKIILFVFLMISVVSCRKDEEKVNTEILESSILHKEYYEKGRNITEASFNSLKFNLMQAMGTKGVGGAIEYCNIAANPLTDSLSEVFGADIRRTTLNWRNPLNKPNNIEKELLDFYENSHKAESKLSDSVVQISENEFLYVKPIFVQGLCMNCHGNTGNTLTDSNYVIIKKLYPQDRAINYKDGDLRGIWSIKFNTK
jgi:hypothetical protein